MSSWEEWTCGKNAWEVQQELPAFTPSRTHPSAFASTVGFMRCCLDTDNTLRVASIGIRYYPERDALELYIRGKYVTTRPMPDTKEELVSWLRMVEEVCRE